MDESGSGGAPVDEAVEQPAVASDRELGVAVGTRLGRIVLGAALSVLVVCIVAWNIPESDARDAARDRARPVVNTLALNQSWALFSPNPSSTSVRVWAELTLEDGSRVAYDFPDGGNLFGALREYRWRKLERRVRLDRYRSLWKPTAQWIVDGFDEERGTVVHIALHREFSRTPEPGSGDPREWSTYQFFDMDVPAP